MTDKPIFEMRLADYKRAFANIERKRYGTGSSQLSDAGAREFVAAAYEKSGGPTEGLRQVYGEFVANEIRKNGLMRQPLNSSAVKAACDLIGKTICVGEQGPDLAFRRTREQERTLNELAKEAQSLGLYD